MYQKYGSKIMVILEKDYKKNLEVFFSIIQIGQVQKFIEDEYVRMEFSLVIWRRTRQTIVFRNTLMLNNWPLPKAFGSRWCLFNSESKN